MDGVIVTNLETDDKRVPVLERLRLPVVVAGGPGGHGSLPAVWNDDSAAMATTTEYLIALGHRRLGRVAGMPQLLHTRIRTDAFLGAASRAGLPAPSVVHTDYSREAGARATRSLLTSRQPPTAIVYDNDQMAAEGVGVAREMGVAVPQSLSLVAWEESALCQLVHPALSAIYHDISAYGASAARLLMAVLAGEPVADQQASILRLVPRESTGPAPEQGRVC